MTSMPASRSASATTFAPRSWPSSPGLASSTRRRFGMGISDADRLPEPAEHVDEDTIDFTDGAVRLDTVDLPRNEVFSPARRALQLLQRRAHLRAVALPLHLREARNLPFADARIRLEQRELRLLL